MSTITTRKTTQYAAIESYYYSVVTGALDMLNLIRADLRAMKGLEFVATSSWMHRTADRIQQTAFILAGITATKLTLSQPVRIDDNADADEIRASYESAIDNMLAGIAAIESMVVNLPGYIDDLSPIDELSSIQTMITYLRFSILSARREAEYPRIRDFATNQESIDRLQAYFNSVGIEAQKAIVIYSELIQLPEQELAQLIADEHMKANSGNRLPLVPTVLARATDDQATNAKADFIIVADDGSDELSAAVRYFCSKHPTADFYTV